jgi:SAM-dependent methyltransferase
VADLHYEDPQLAELYDPFDADRSDLEVYASLVDELGGESLLDVGCGTGTFCCLLAGRGKRVTGIDPADAELQVARRKDGADRVRWLHGDGASVPPLGVDVVTMTGNVAQVFLTDHDWYATLRAVHAALRLGGWLVFETRDPAREAWRKWTRSQSFQQVKVPGVGPVSNWVELTEVAPPYVSFRSVFVFEADNTVKTSDSTLRFRDRSEVKGDLEAVGFAVDAVRDAPDRPGREFVFVARRIDPSDKDSQAK